MYYIAGVWGWCEKNCQCSCQGQGQGQDLRGQDHGHKNWPRGISKPTRRAFGKAHLPPTTVFRRLKTTRRWWDGRRITMPNTCTWDFPDVTKFRVAVHMISEKAIRFRHLDYDPDLAQKFISSSMSRRLSTRKMSSKSMHAFLSNLSNSQTQTGRQTNAGNRIYLLRCQR